MIFLSFQQVLWRFCPVFISRMEPFDQFIDTFRDFCDIKRSSMKYTWDIPKRNSPSLRKLQQQLTEKDSWLHSISRTPEAVWIFLMSLNFTGKYQRLSFTESVRDESLNESELTSHFTTENNTMSRKRQSQRKKKKKKKRKTHAVLSSDRALADVFGFPRQLLKHREKD